MENFLSSDGIAIVAGAALLCGGWLLYYMALWISGAIIVGAMGAALGFLGAKLAELNPPWDIAMMAVSAFAGAALGVYAFRLMHKMVFFGLGFLAGLALGWVTLEPLRSLGITEALDGTAMGAIYCVIAAMIAGLLCAWIDWVLIALGTVAAGALLLSSSLELGPEGTLVAAVGGLVVQVGLKGVLGRRQAAEEGSD